MASLEQQRRIVQAKIAGAEGRKADLARLPRGAARSAQAAALDLEIGGYRDELRKLERGG
jgi:hypothetical protein